MSCCTSSLSGICVKCWDQNIAASTVLFLFFFIVIWKYRLLERWLKSLTTGKLHQPSCDYSHLEFLLLLCGDKLQSHTSCTPTLWPHTKRRSPFIPNKNVNHVQNNKQKQKKKMTKGATNGQKWLFGLYTSPEERILNGKIAVLWNAPEQMISVILV